MKPLAKEVLTLTQNEEVVLKTLDAGYWISPYGDLIPTKKNHITTVLEAPDKFGLSMKQIQDVYARHGEAVGTEGEARKEIILSLVQQGWIRVRSYTRRGDITWSINIKRLTDRVKDHITDFFQKIAELGTYMGSVVNIDSPTGVESFSPREIAEYALFKTDESHKDIKHKLRMVEDIRDM